METIKQRREKLIEERINEKLIKETEEYLLKKKIIKGVGYFL